MKGMYFMTKLNRRIGIMLFGMVFGVVLSTSLRAQDADVKAEEAKPLAPAPQAAQPPAPPPPLPDSTLKEESVSTSSAQSDRIARDSEEDVKPQTKTQTNKVAEPEKSSFWSGMSSGLIWFGVVFVVLLVVIFMFT